MVARASTEVSERGAKDQLDLTWWKLDFLASLYLCVIDSDPKHGETLLQLLRTCSGAVFGLKFGLQSAVHFKRVT